jgi:hypothetical protein
MQKITEDCENIPKNGYNSFSNYKYVTAIDVIGHIKKLLIEHGVSLKISENKLERSQHGKNFHSFIECEATFTNVDNKDDFTNVKYMSVSADTLDKDIFKAKTNGLKYLLSQTFLIVTNDFIDTESDKGQKEMMAPPKSNGINDYVFKSGKFIGKKMYDISADELKLCKSNMIAHAKNEGKSLSEVDKLWPEMVEKIEAYLKELQK